MSPFITRATLALVGLSGLIAALSCATPEASRPGARTEDERRLVDRAQHKGWVEMDPAALRRDAKSPAATTSGASKTAAAEPAPVMDAPVTPAPPAPSRAPSAIAAMTVAPPKPAGPPPDPTAAAAAPAKRDPGAAGSIELRDVELKDLLRASARMSGRNLIVPEELTQKVTLSLNGVSLDEAIAAVLKANKLEMIEEAGIYHVRKVETPAPKIESRAFNLASVPVGTVQKSIEPLLGPQGKMVINPESNSILVIDFPEGIERVEAFVKLLDHREKQVLIEARILEVILSHDDEIGVSLAFTQISIDDVTAMFTQDLRPANRAFRFSVVGDNGRINAILDAIAQRRQVNLLSHPSVATVNGQQATIEVLEAIPYIDSTATTTTSAGGLGSTTVSQVKFADKGITLTVLPLIGDDRVIKMKVVPEVRELTDFFNGIPVIDRRKVETTILVRDSQTIVIGGLLRENHIQDETKVPLLGDIPLLGSLFRKRLDNVQKSELLVLITPRILDPGTDDAVTQERQKSLEKRRSESDQYFSGDKK